MAELEFTNAKSFAINLERVISNIRVPTKEVILDFPISPNGNNMKPKYVNGLLSKLSKDLIIKKHLGLKTYNSKSDSYFDYYYSCVIARKNGENLTSNLLNILKTITDYYLDVKDDIENELILIYNNKSIKSTTGKYYDKIVNLDFPEYDENHEDYEKEIEFLISKYNETLGNIGPGFIIHYRIVGPLLVMTITALSRSSIN